MGMVINFGVWAMVLAGVSSIWMPHKAMAQDSLPSQHFLAIGFDDDFLNVAGQGTDQYYTGGDYLRFSFLAVAGRRNLLRKILYSPYPSGASLYTIGVSQWVYTPDRLSSSKPVIGDYPYCGVLFLSLSRETLSPDRSRLFRSGLSLGIMGPSALGKEIQRSIHGMIHTDKPLGWDSQLPDYPVVDYGLYYEPNLFSISRSFKVNGYASVQAGTLQTHAETGVDLLISTERDNFFPYRDVRQGNRSRRRVKFYLQAEPAVRFVGYNSMLQGGPFDNRHYYHIPAGQITRVLFEGTGVAGMQWGDFSIQYRQVIESAEFKTVGKHVYGGFVFQWRI